MTTHCTWKGCTNPATKPQTAADGQQWANLCVDHEKEFMGAPLTPKALCRAWVLAQGGAAAAAQRMQPAVKASARLWTELFEKAP